jgi:flavodoxin
MRKVLIIFDTTFGNTERLAREIATGITESGTVECDVLNQKDAKDVDYSLYDGFLFGGPVHVFRAARGIRKAVEKACKAGLEGKFVAAFDTYQAASHKYKGTETIEKIIVKKAPDARLFTPGLSALVLGREGPLSDDEPANAREYGQRFSLELG